MNNTEYENAVKYLAKKYSDILNSKNYTAGKHVYSAICCIRSLNICKLIRDYIKMKRVKASIKRFDDNTLKAETTLVKDSYVITQSNYTITVYSCLVGEYDKPNGPLIRYSNCRYIMYCDREIEIRGWEVRNIPDKVLKLGNGTLINRYMKMHPSEFFDTDYAFYIDAHIWMVSSIEDLLDFIPQASGIAMFDHPYRNCLYREMAACIYQKLGNVEQIKKYRDRLRAEGMPEQYGLKEATVVLVDLNNKESVSILEAWWSEFLCSESYRDQISFPYVLWKKGISSTGVGSLGDNIRNDGHFIILGHNRTSDV